MNNIPIWSLIFIVFKYEVILLVTYNFFTRPHIVSQSRLQVFGWKNTLHWTRLESAWFKKLRRLNNGQSSRARPNFECPLMPSLVLGDKFGIFPPEFLCPSGQIKRPVVLQLHFWGLEGDLIWLATEFSINKRESCYTFPDFLAFIKRSENRTISFGFVRIFLFNHWK